MNLFMEDEIISLGFFQLFFLRSNQVLNNALKKLRVQEFAKVNNESFLIFQVAVQNIDYLFLFILPLEDSDSNSIP